MDSYHICLPVEYMKDSTKSKFATNRANVPAKMRNHQLCLGSSFPLPAFYGGLPAGPFFIKGPLKLASHGPLWSPLGGPGRSRRFPRALAEFLDDQKINLTWLEGLQSLKCRNSKHSLTKDLSKLKVRNISSDTCPILTKL